MADLLALLNHLTDLVQKWDEEAHPREPAGSPGGGQFTSGEGGGVGDGSGGSAEGSSGGGGTSPAPARSPQARIQSLGLAGIDDTSGAAQSRSEELMNATADVLESLHAAGPPVGRGFEIAINNSRLRVEIQKGKTLASETHPGARAFATYSKNDHAIRIAGGLNLGGASAVPKVGAGAYNVGTDFRTVLAHEVAHGIGGSIARAASQAGQPDLVDVFRSKPKSYWERTVSTYAGTNAREMLSEAFAAYTHPGYSQSRGLPPEMTRYFEAAGLRPGTRKEFLLRFISWELSDLREQLRETDGRAGQA